MTGDQAMCAETIRIGIVGAGANTRQKHIPGLRAQDGVQITAVCNRSRASSERAAAELGIPRAFERWEDLVRDPDVDAVVIGTWPYLHAPITVAALDAGKHVLCEARMAASLAEAHSMLEASRRHPGLVAQLVPSPYGFRADRVVKRLLAAGFLGPMREIHVSGMTAVLADPKAPLHWRQSARYSGVNMLTLGILHETVLRWVAPPVRVLAQTHRFTMMRHDAETGRMAVTGAPDSVGVLTEHADGARGIYRFSGAVHFGPGHAISLYGAEGTIEYHLGEDRLYGARVGESALREIPIPEEEAYSWRVEAEFIGAIRGRERIEFTDFPTGVEYMTFVDAVARSALSRQAVPVG